VARIGGPDNIRCNGVSPGLATDPDRELPDPKIKEVILKDQCLPRLGYYSDIAAMMAFLLSDDGEWITGQTISVNGGLAFRD
jgi:NAD(P)-dependent dehydrogenase (short-subunit alcohol dehydrogenase family)